jgi:hypothetical protein
MTNYAEPIIPSSRSLRRKTSPFGIVRRAAYTAKLIDVDPLAWLADVLSRISDHPASRLGELLAVELTGASILGGRLIMPRV